MYYFLCVHTSALVSFHSPIALLSIFQAFKSAILAYFFRTPHVDLCGHHRWMISNLKCIMGSNRTSLECCTRSDMYILHWQNK